MTTRALMRASKWDADTARDHLRERVVAGQGVLGGQAVTVYVEPLLKDDGRGGLLQSIRVDVDDPVTEAIVRTDGGTTVPSVVEPGPAGIRVLVPEVDSTTAVRLSLPQLSADDAIAVELTPQRHWTIHLVHHTHLDIGYTDPQGTVLNEHLSFLDSCLDLTHETQDWPEDARFRWCVEALWSFEQWAKARPVARVQELIDRVHEGRIELTAMPFNLHTETCSTDELHELLRLSRDVRKTYGVEFTSAMQTDVPGCVAGLPDALTQAGVRYLSVAHNWAGRSVPHLVGGQDLPRLFRWQAPSGASVLVWVTDTPHGMAYMEGPMLGFERSYEVVDDLLPAYLTSLANNPYPYGEGVFGSTPTDTPLYRKPYGWDILHLRVQGKFADNAPPRRIMSETVRSWNEQWAFPRLRLSRNEDFFVEAEQRYGDEIKTFEGDWNDWWADGVGSGARPMQLCREAQGRIADAQTIGSLAGVSGADGAEDDTRDARPAYLAASLFDEHTWGAGDPWTHGDHGFHSGEQQWHWKYGQSIRAHDEATTLMNRTVARLASTTGTAAGSLASFHVVNTCSWKRTDIAELFLPESRVPLEVGVAVVDSRSGKQLPFDTRPQTNPNHRDAGRFLLVAVDDVPSLGRVRLDIVASDDPESAAVIASAGNLSIGAEETAFEGGNLATDTVLENEFLRVEVDLSTATIRSIVDKLSGRELVNADATVGFNGYVYDEYGSAPHINHLSGKVAALNGLEMLGRRSLARPAALLEHSSTATVERIVYEAGGPGVEWIRTTLILPHGVNRLDIENRIAKPVTAAKESAYFSFPFAFADPTVRVEATGGVVGTDIPAVPGGAHYMRAMRRWISMESDGQAVAWSTQDAALVQLRQISLPYAPFPPTLVEDEPGTIFSWVHNNLWDTNFPSQQGFEMTFRYSVAASANAEGTTLGVRTAAATSRPLVGVLAPRGTTIAPQEQIETSWLQLSDDRVRIVGVITPQPGRLLLRLQSVAAEPIRLRITTPLDVSTASLATYVGETRDELDVVDGAVDATIPPYTAEAVLLALRA